MTANAMDHDGGCHCLRFGAAVVYGFCHQAADAGELGFAGGFVGGGVENSLNIFGISSPGWFMKTEYRAAYYGNKNISELADGTNVPVGTDIAFKPFVQTISTSLVYRFNWTGPAVAKY